jgi:hypothetical protein
MIDVGCHTNTVNPSGEGWITVRLKKANLSIVNLGVIKIVTIRSGMTVRVIARTGMTTNEKAIASMQIMAIPMTRNVHYLLIFRVSLLTGVVADHRNRGPNAGRPHMANMHRDRRLRKASGTLPRKKPIPHPDTIRAGTTPLSVKTNLDPHLTTKLQAGDGRMPARGIMTGKQNLEMTGMPGGSMTGPLHKTAADMRMVTTTAVMAIILQVTIDLAVNPESIDISRRNANARKSWSRTDRIH